MGSSPSQVDNLKIDFWCIKHINLIWLLMVYWAYISFSLQSDFPSVNLCAYPFILNAQAKTTMLQTDAELQMQVPDTHNEVCAWINFNLLKSNVFDCPS